MCLPIWKRKPEPSRPSASPTPFLPETADISKAKAVQLTPTGNKSISTEPTVTATPSDSPPQVKQIPAVPKSLPSQVDETLAECPRFRILLVGNSGVGKTSLVRHIFNIDPDSKSHKIDIQHDCAGEADIEYEYTSPANPRFILHDSKGFEAGSKLNWDTVEKFLQNRSKYDLDGRIHAIWFCVETPRIGMRLLQTGDEMLLKLGKKFNIPIIAVFTKYDRLVTQFWRQDHQSGKSEQKKNDDAEKKASESFERSVKELREECVKSQTGLSISCVGVSTTDTEGRRRLIDLTNETRSMLQDVEDKLRVLWVAAQQVNARQKVEVSISEGFKKYWRDLGQSSKFEGQILVDCIHRIHDDVLKVWNFNDPTKILSGTEFFTRMIRFVKPLIDDQVDQTLLPAEPVPGFGSTGATVLVPLLQNFGFKLQAIQYLYDKYQKYPSTAKFLATYIINLILILHGVFTELLQSSDLPRALSNDLVFEVLKSHNADLSKPAALDDDDFATNPEKVIDNIIRKRLGLL